VASYLQLNREITSRRIHSPGPLWGEVKEEEYPHRQERKKFDADSLVGEGCVFGEKTTVKRSTVGKHCDVGNSVKIGNSVVMDNVKIGDGAKVDGCVICSGAEVPAGVQLTGCKVGYGHKIPADTPPCKNDTLCDEQEFQEDGEEWEY
jgi:translation initiation factor eIF-2B subunit gamma